MKTTTQSDAMHCVLSLERNRQYLYFVSLCQWGPSDHNLVALQIHLYTMDVILEELFMPSVTLML